MTPARSAPTADGDTRYRLLRAAAAEIHVHGFQAASLARILPAAGVTKGALYHYFGSKRSLGYAVLDEVYAPVLRRLWIAPLADGDHDPVQALIALIREAAAGLSPADVVRGCPVNNLAQEMSPVDAGFRTRIEGLLAEWREATTQALARAQRLGRLADDRDPASTAVFIVAAIEGCIGMAKNAQSHELLVQCSRGLIAYLENLHSPAERRGMK